MLKVIRFLGCAVFLAGLAQGQLCPGFNSAKNVNLACELATVRWFPRAGLPPELGRFVTRILAAASEPGH